MGGVLERQRELWNWKAERGGVTTFAKKEGVQHVAKENRTRGVARN